MGVGGDGVGSGGGVVAEGEEEEGWWWGQRVEDGGRGVGHGEYGWGAWVYGLEARGQRGKVGRGGAGYRRSHIVMYDEAPQLTPSMPLR